MFSSSARGQTEPLAALVAVAAVGVGLSLYAGVLDDALAEPSDRAIADATLDRVERAVAADGVVRSAALTDGLSSAPAGYSINVTLRSEHRQWSAGPSPANDAMDRAERPVSVRVGPTDVRPGTLEVVVLR